MDAMIPQPRSPVATKDYGRQNQQIWPELSAAVLQTLRDDKPILGAAVARFETELAAWFGVSAAVGVGSGTDALILALRALGVGPGDEVITCGHTFSGVLSAILLAGATPVLLEPEATYGQLDPTALAAALTPRTRAVLAVHLYGHPVDLDLVGTFCAAHDLALIEDCAQAHGARWRGRRVGSFGDLATLSFHPSKNLGAFGDGGAVLCKTAAQATQLRVWRNLGKDGKYRFTALASNTKLDTLQAAILSVKLGYLQAWLDRRVALAERYLAGLSGLPQLQLPATEGRAQHAWHLFVVRTARRDGLRQHLAEHGIGSSLNYPIAAHLQPGLRPYLASAPTLPRAEAWAATCLSLPLTHAHTDAEIDRVIAAVRGFFS